MSNTVGVLQEAGTAYPFESTWFHTCFFLVGSMFYILLLFCIVCFCPVSCVPNVDSVNGLSILDFPIGFLEHLFCSVKYLQVDIEQ